MSLKRETSALDGLIKLRARGKRLLKTSKALGDEGETTNNVVPELETRRGKFSETKKS